jgi:hypothetical protein
MPVPQHQLNHKFTYMRFMQRLTLSHFDFLFCLPSRGAASAAFADECVPLAVTTETPER